MTFNLIISNSFATVRHNLCADQLEYFYILGCLTRRENLKVRHSFAMELDSPPSTSTLEVAMDTNNPSHETTEIRKSSKKIKLNKNVICSCKHKLGVYAIRTRDIIDSVEFEQKLKLKDHDICFLNSANTKQQATMQQKINELKATSARYYFSKNETVIGKVM